MDDTVAEPAPIPADVTVGDAPKGRTDGAEPIVGKEATEALGVDILVSWGGIEPGRTFDNDVTCPCCSGTRAAPLCRTKVGTFGLTPG